MNTNFFAIPTEVIAGLLVGLVFGFVLNKAAVTRAQTIVGQLMLKDFTVMKVMMTAIATGSLTLFLLRSFHPVPASISATTLFAALLGGGIFGIGMAVLGYCPGTCVGALSTKAKDAWFGLIGMLVGAGLYAEAAPWIKQAIKPDSETSKITLSEHFELSPLSFIGAIALCVAFLILFDKYQSKKNPENRRSNL